MNSLSISQDSDKKRFDQRKLKYEVQSCMFTECYFLSAQTEDVFWLYLSPPQRLVSIPLDLSPESLKDPVKICIPRYVLCGQGKDEHFEFEVKVCLCFTLNICERRDLCVCLRTEFLCPGSDHCSGWNLDGVQKIQSFSGDAQIYEGQISRGMMIKCTDLSIMRSIKCLQMFVWNVFKH